MEMKEIREICREFLEFSVNFRQIFKSKFEKTCGIKANSLAFHALMMLQSLNEQSLTMSALAEKLDITKQQLTKLINMLEEKDLVERFHDQKNRRQVYIQITGEGRQVIGALCGELLQAVAENFTALDDGELMELKEALRTMKKLMGKLEQREIL